MKINFIVELIGYANAVLGVAMLMMRTIIPLRIVGIAHMPRYSAGCTAAARSLSGFATSSARMKVAAKKTNAMIAVT
jgi:hypothetical protein